MMLSIRKSKSNNATVRMGMVGWDCGQGNPLRHVHNTNRDCIRSHSNLTEDTYSVCTWIHQRAHAFEEICFGYNCQVCGPWSTSIFIQSPGTNRRPQSIEIKLLFHN